MRLPYWYEEEHPDDTYFDYKCEEVVFPNHDDKEPSECIIYSIEDLYKLI
jgi:hypothetical protein